VIVGIPKETKVREYRVGMVPGGVKSLVAEGHTVLVEAGAGEGSGIGDDEYDAMGAEIVDAADDVWGRADLIVKVKEPTPSEYDLIRPEQALYAFFHLAAFPDLAQVLLDRRATVVAYETVQADDGSLPLLRPMSEVAGKMAVQVGASCLEKEHGGKGLLLGGVPGVRPGRVTIIGGGSVGVNAARVAVGMGAIVRILDRDLERLVYLDDVFGGRVITLYSDHSSLIQSVLYADLVIGAVLVTGAKAPQLVTEAMVSQMEPGSVIIDVSVDQGGCIETARPTTHDDPTYITHDVVHYCVTNMPGAVAHTSTFALTNATIDGVLQIARHGVIGAAERNPALRRGVNCHRQRLTHETVAASLGRAYTPLERVGR
jgi:alanine dehydrogenase